MASNNPLTEIREEGAVDSATDIAVVTRNPTAVHDPTSSPRICPPIFSRPRGARRGSSASRVEVDFFDKEGVNELSRTLTRMSTHETLHVPDDGPQASDSDVASEETLANPDRPFDFEKAFRHYMKQYVILMPCHALTTE
jgi:ATP-binding cassette, subfamily G (WHITE), member 2, SNQ2